MPYYDGRGDYYYGDYYRGDPGIGSFFKRAIGFVGKAIVPAPIRAAVDVATSVLSGGGGGRSLVPTQIPVTPVPGIRGFLQRAVPGGATGLEVDPRVMGLVRKRRRMNVANVKALRRAIRRAMGFEKLARRVGHFTHPGAGYRLKVRRGRKRK